MASKRGIIAGKAFIVLEAIDNTPRVLGRVRANFMRFAANLQNLGASLITRGIAAATPAAVSMKIFSDFDDAMRRVEARSGGTADQLKQVRIQAMFLGRTTAFTARMIANLQSILAQRGFSRGQLLQMTPNVMNLARAAGSGNRGQDILTSADLVSGAIRAFKINAADASKVADIFTAAVNNSNFSLEDLIISMGNVGPIAAQFKPGVGGLAETVATLAAMRNVNIDPSIAGTGLRNLFLKASDAKRRKDFNEFLKEMTGNTIQFIDAAGNLQHIPSILNSINNAMEGLGTAQRGDLLADLFGLRAIVPAAALAGAKDQVDKMMMTIQNAGGLAVKTAEMMDRGIGGSFRILVSATEGLAIALGTVLAPAIQTLNEVATKVQTSVSGWIGENKNLVATLNFMAVSLIPIGIAIFALGLAFKLAAIAMLPMILALHLIIIPFKLVAAAVSTLWSLLTVANLVMIAAGFMAIVAAVYVLPNLMSRVGGIFTSLVSGIVSGARKIVNAFLGIASDVMLVMGGVTGALRAGQFELATEIGIAGMKLIWIKFKNFLINLWNDILDKIHDTFQEIQKIGSALLLVKFHKIPSSKLRRSGPDIGAENAQRRLLEDLFRRIDPSRDIIEDFKRRITGAGAGLSRIPEVFNTNQNLVRAGITRHGGRFGVPQRGVEAKTGEALIQFFKNLQRVDKKNEDIQGKQLGALQDIETNTRNITVSGSADIAGV